MKKFLVGVILLAIVAGGGYGWWVWNQRSAPVQDTAELPEPEPVPEAPADVPTGPQQLVALACELVPAAGWSLDEAPPEAAIVPGGQAVAYRKGAPGSAPFLLIGRLTPDALAGVSAERYPNAFLAELRSRLGKLQPVPTITASGPAKQLPALFTTGQELLAEGSFERLGLPAGSARMLAGVTADQQVYLLVAFTNAGSPDEAEVDTMIASLRPPTPSTADDSASPAEPEATPESTAADPNAAAPEAAPGAEPAGAPGAEPAGAPAGPEAATPEAEAPASPEAAQPAAATETAPAAPVAPPAAGGPGATAEGQPAPAAARNEGL